MQVKLQKQRLLEEKHLKALEKGRRGRKTAGEDDTAQKSPHAQKFRRSVAAIVVASRVQDSMDCIAGTKQWLTLSVFISMFDEFSMVLHQVQSVFMRLFLSAVHGNTPLKSCGAMASMVFASQAQSSMVFVA